MNSATTDTKNPTHIKESGRFAQDEAALTKVEFFLQNLELKNKKPGQ